MWNKQLLWFLLIPALGLLISCSGESVPATNATLDVPDTVNTTAPTNNNPPLTVEVLDGDTIELNGQKYRLGCMDAPEVAKIDKEGNIIVPGQEGGLEAKQALSNIISNYGVTIGETTGKSYDRTVATLYTKEGNLNIAILLLAEGHAMLDPRYTNCPNMDRYEKAQQSAENNNLGVWADSNNSIPPWEFRKNR